MQNYSAWIRLQNRIKVNRQSGKQNLLVVILVDEEDHQVIFGVLGIAPDIGQPC